MRRLLIAIALISIGYGAWIPAKAQLAQVLLRVAWHRQAKPWPGADTYPVARMIIGDDDFIVLEGANGPALAFAPGHLERTAMPGEPGNCVISAHRDTQRYVLTARAQPVPWRHGLIARTAMETGDR